MEQQAPAVTTRIDRVRARIADQGLLRTAGSVLATLASPVVRRRERLIWEVDIGGQAPSVWKDGERLLIFGPDNIDRNLTVALRSFLGETPDEIESVRGGDRLFIVASGEEFLACSYIFFDTTVETRRHARIYGEPRNTPIIGMSFTAPAARGRGIYRRMLNDMFVYLAGMGFRRAVCEVDPRNTPSNRASEGAGMRVCRQVCDWEFLKSIFVQRVTEGRRSRWRVLWA